LIIVINILVNSVTVVALQTQALFTEIGSTNTHIQ